MYLGSIAVSSLFLFQCAVTAQPWAANWRSRITQWVKKSNNTANTVYFLENNPAGASIVSLQVYNGQVGTPVRVLTGGNGALSVNRTNGQDFAVDTLGSQGSVIVSGNFLFTVNSGSNTLSMFTIDPSNACEPKLVSVTDTLGDFPISLTYSEILQTICVLNSGARSGVSCFYIDGSLNLITRGPLRSLGRAINETTPPLGPPGAAAQIKFNPDSSAILATVKGNSQPGSILAWPVVNGNVSEVATTLFQDEDLLLDFGFTFLDQDQILLSLLTQGGATLAITSDLQINQLTNITIAGASASCWTEYDRELNMAYIIDGGVNSIYKVDPSTGEYVGTIDVGDVAGGGVFDSIITDNNMVSLTAANGVIVVDLVAEKVSQFLNLTDFGDRVFYQGMARWPASKNFA